MAGLALWRPSGGSEGPASSQPPTKNKGPITPAKAYSESVPQQTNDYSDMMSRFRSALDQPSGMSSLMQNYQNLLNKTQQPLTDFGQEKTAYQDILGRDPFTPEDQAYERGPEMTGAMGNLSELAKTGGYDEEAIADLRARGTSPIRSVYANAMRELERSKALQGGYAPGAGAATAKMAREQAGLLSGATTDINAGIAERQAAGRLSAAPQYTAAAGQETNLMNEIARRNLESKTGAESFNLQRELAALQGLTGIKGTEAELGKSNTAEQLAALSGMTNLEQLGAGKESDLLRGMTSLYGTSPALVSTFGNQVSDAAQLDATNRARGLTIPRRTGGLALSGSNAYGWR